MLSTTYAAVYLTANSIQKVSIKKIRKWTLQWGTKKGNHHKSQRRQNAENNNRKCGEVARRRPQTADGVGPWRGVSAGHAWGSQGAPGGARPAAVLAAPAPPRQRQRHAVFPRGPHVLLACHKTPTKIPN